MAKPLTCSDCGVALRCEMTPSAPEPHVFESTTGRVVGRYCRTCCPRCV